MDLKEIFNKDIFQKKNARRAALVALAAAVAAGAAVLPFALSKNSEAETKASIRSAYVEKDTVRKTISGAGTLTDQEASELSIPQGVKLTEYLVSNGQTVSEGDAVAKVDRASVMETISAARGAMDEVAAELSSSSGGELTNVSAPASGRVKAVYAKKGDSVRDVINEYGSLAVVSLDGLMAASLPAGGLFEGQTVTVVLSDGKEVEGRVESTDGGEASVTISDRWGSMGETVEIKDDTGRSVGSAELYVHSAWKAMATAGTVQVLYVSPDQSCRKGGTLMSVDGTDSVSRELLLEEYRDYEDTMAALFRMYQSGAAEAPCGGYVSGVDESLITGISAKGGRSVVLLANAPGSDPDGTYRNRVGMVTAINEDGTVTVKMQPFDTPVDDYQATGMISTDAGSMTEESVIYPPPAYYWNGSDWVGRGVQAGDVFIFAYSDSLAWMVYVGHNDVSEEDPNPGPNPPGGGGGGGGQFPGGSFTGGFGDAAQEEQEPDLLTEITVLSVTPLEKVTVSITVDELDILSVSEGQDVTVTLDALAGQSFPGVITEVNTEASNEGGHSKYSAVVELERTEKMLGGMNASARIVVEERGDVLVIPAEALAELDGQPVVYTGYDSKAGELIDPAAVEFGLSDGMQIEILSGLAENDEIWYETYDRLDIDGLS